MPTRRSTKGRAAFAQDKRVKARVLSDDFYHKVYEVVMQIPLGRVTTYGAIAEFIGARRSSRMVGHALKVVPDDMALPCHRVVNRNGELSGRHYFATPTLMRDLLESEGVGFSGDAVILAEHFWDPAGT
jgi:methylated-DNA-protein-cysteine methyltransferase related protein